MAIRFSNQMSRTGGDGRELPGLTNQLRRPDKDGLDREDNPKGPPEASASVCIEFPASSDRTERIRQLGARPRKATKCPSHAGASSCGAPRRRFGTDNVGGIWRSVLAIELQGPTRRKQSPREGGGWEGRRKPGVGVGLERFLPVVVEGSLRTATQTCPTLGRRAP